MYDYRIIEAVEYNFGKDAIMVNKDTRKPVYKALYVNKIKLAIQDGIKWHVVTFYGSMDKRGLKKFNQILKEVFGGVRRT